MKRKSILAISLFIASPSAQAAEGSLPTLGRAMVQSVANVHVKQTLSPAGSKLSILGDNIVVSTANQKAGLGESVGLTVIIPYKTTVPATIRMSVRGALMTSDRTTASCSVWANEKAISSWSTKDGLLMDVVRSVAPGSSKVVFVLGLSCTASQPNSQARADVDSFDVVIEPRSKKKTSN